MLAKLYDRKFISCVFSLAKFIDAIDKPEDYAIEEKRYYRTGEIFNDKIFHVILKKSDILDTRFADMIIERFVVADSLIKNSIFTNIQFVESRFDHVKFSDVVFVSCSFYFCFINYSSIRCKFIDCCFINLEIKHCSTDLINQNSFDISHFKSLCYNCFFEDNIKSKL